MTLSNKPSSHIQGPLKTITTINHEAIQKAPSRKNIEAMLKATIKIDLEAHLKAAFKKLAFLNVILKFMNNNTKILLALLKVMF